VIEERTLSNDPPEGDYVAFRRAGEEASGEFRCADCGYGVAVFRGLPPCPMCGGTIWEAAWSPGGRTPGVL
jgi:hypothetical protein